MGVISKEWPPGAIAGLRPRKHHLGDNASMSRRTGIAPMQEASI